MREMYWHVNVSNDTTSLYVNWKLLLMLDWIVMRRFTPLKMCLLWKFSMPFLVHKEHAADKEGIFSVLSKEPLTILGKGENQAERACTCCKWYGYSNCSRRSHVHHWLGCLFSVNAGAGILLYMSRLCALSHQIFMQFSPFLSLLQKGEQYQDPWCNGQWHETCLEVYV
jgi:hypothetical protein